MGGLATAIRNLKPGAEWQLEGDTLEGLEMLDGSEPPTQREVDRELARLQEIEEQTAYQKERRDAYLRAGITPGALLVALWEKDVEDRPQEANRLQIARERIKERYPSPDEEDRGRREERGA